MVVHACDSEGTVVRLCVWVRVGWVSARRPNAVKETTRARGGQKRQIGFLPPTQYLATRGAVRPDSPCDKMLKWHNLQPNLTKRKRLSSAAATKDEYLKRDRERKRATASTRYVKVASKVECMSIEASSDDQLCSDDQGCDLEEGIAVCFLDRLPSDLALMIAAQLTILELERATTGLIRGGDFHQVLKTEAMARRKQRVDAWEGERDGLVFAYASEAANADGLKRLSKASPQLAWCAELVRAAADARINWALQHMMHVFAESRSKVAVWAASLLPQTDEHYILLAFSAHVLERTEAGKRRQSCSRVDGRAMRGQVAALESIWEPLVSALNAGSSVEKREAEKCLRARGVALGVLGF